MRCFNCFRLYFLPGIYSNFKNSELMKFKQIYQQKQTFISISNAIFVSKSVPKKIHYLPLCSNENLLNNLKNKDTNISTIFKQNAKSMASYNEYRKKDHLTSSFVSTLVKNLPAPLVSYSKLMRLDKPTGTWLLLLPCYWSLSLSTCPGSLPSLTNILLFTTGAITMRSAGCIVNDILDRKFDSKVERTKNRPLVTNEITLSDSVALLGSLLGSSLLILIQFDIKR